MASFRNILAVTSLFVILSIVSSAPAGPDVDLDLVAIGGNSAAAGGSAGSDQQSVGQASTNNGGTSASASGGNYASSGQVSESLVIASESNCNNCDESSLVSDSYSVNYQDAGNSGSAEAGANGHNAQSVAVVTGDTYTQNSGGAGTSGGVDTSG